jgi:hypothetical protein
VASLFALATDEQDVEPADDGDRNSSCAVSGSRPSPALLALHSVLVATDSVGAAQALAGAEMAAFGARVDDTAADGDAESNTNTNNRGLPALLASLAGEGDAAAAGWAWLGLHILHTRQHFLGSVLRHALALADRGEVAPLCDLFRPALLAPLRPLVLVLAWPHALAAVTQLAAAASPVVDPLAPARALLAALAPAVVPTAGTDNDVDDDDDDDGARVLRLAGQWAAYAVTVTEEALPYLRTQTTPAVLLAALTERLLVDHRADNLLPTLLTHVALDLAGAARCLAWLERCPLSASFLPDAAAKRARAVQGTHAFFALHTLARSIAADHVRLSARGDAKAAEKNAVESLLLWVAVDCGVGVFCCFFVCMYANLPQITWQPHSGWMRPASMCGVLTIGRCV